MECHTSVIFLWASLSLLAGKDCRFVSFLNLAVVVSKVLSEVSRSRSPGSNKCIEKREFLKTIWVILTISTFLFRQSQITTFMRSA